MTSTQDCSTTTQAAAPLSAERRAILDKLGLIHESDVCVLCNVRSETLWTWRRDRKGPSFVKLGREICYRLADVIAWIEANVTAHLPASLSMPPAANDPKALPAPGLVATA